MKNERQALNPQTFILFGVHQDALRDHRPKDVPVVASRDITKQARERYKSLLAETPSTRDLPFTPPQPTSILQGQGSHFFFFDNPERVERYIQRARESNGLIPPPGNLSFHALNPNEYVGRVAGSNTTIAINNTPYTDTTVIFIPAPIHFKETEGIFLEATTESTTSRNGKIIFERTQHPSFFTSKDFIEMGGVAQEGKMILWYNGSTPSQKYLHYHGMSDRVNGQYIPLVDAAINERVTKTSVTIGYDSQGYPINMNGIVTDEPEEAVKLLYGLDKADHPADLFVVRGKNHPLFMMFPTPRDQDVTVTFFPKSGQNWQWMPSAEKAGFLLLPSFVTLPEANGFTVNVGSTPYTIDDFNTGLFKTLNNNHPSSRELQTLLRSL